jgi:hypothetical protein
MRHRSLKGPSATILLPRRSAGYYVIDETDNQKAKTRLAQLRAAGRIAYIRPDRPDRIEVIE